VKYQVLARRYRPRRFEEVVGQESVATTLKAGIQQERVAHAYLFAGPRGIGKTSMARIFAKALNCPQAADRTGPRERWGEPCDSCSTCEAIHLGQDIDVVELDGASHRGIEDIRGIIEGVNRPATKSPFKVYIVDEVHMLTREAFNALLKTLEEPPAHVKFIFATTEPHRIPETVLSRCQRFDFHPIGEEAIVRRLAQILTAEGRSGEPGLLEKVARFGKGGLRDAQTLLDQLMTFSEEELRLEDLDRITGRVPEQALAQLIQAVLGGDPASVLEHVRGYFARGADPSMVLEQMIEGIRDRIHARILESPGEGGAPSLDKLIGCLQILIDAASKLKYSPFAEISVEVVLLKLTRLEEPRVLDEALRALAEIERREGSGTAPSPPAASPVARPRPRAESAAAAEGQTLYAPAAEGRVGQARSDEGPVGKCPEGPVGKGPVAEGPAAEAFRLADLCAVWDQVRVELQAKRPGLVPFLKDVGPQSAEGEPGVFLLRFRNDFAYRQLKSPALLDDLLAIVRDVTGLPWRCRILQEGEARVAGRSAPAPRGGPSEVDRRRGSAPSGGPASAGSALDGGASDGAPGAPPSPDGGTAPPLRGEDSVGPRGSGDLARNPVVKKSLDLFNGRLL
jgi:DNA polymerase-3 subunit gamma/tau